MLLRSRIGAVLLLVCMCPAVNAQPDAPSLPSGARIRLGTLNFRHTNLVQVVRFTPDANTLISSDGGTVILWDASTGRERRRLEGSLQALSRSGKIMAIGWDKIQLVDVASGKELHLLQGHKGAVLSAAFSPDGATLLAGGDDRTIRLWKVADG